MLRNFLKRIVSEVIKELISPEFEKVYDKMDAGFARVYKEFVKVYEMFDRSSERLEGVL